MRRTFATKWVRGEDAYSAAEIALSLDVKPATVLGWIRKGELIATTSARTKLIQGRDLLAFMETRNEPNSWTLGPDEFFCFGCKKPRIAAQGTLKCESDRTAPCMKVKAACATPMFRAFGHGQAGLLLGVLSAHPTRLPNTM